jgi:outer membrane protein assembly factor BamD
MKQLISILLLLTLLVSCSDYQKVLKSEDSAEKFKMGNELYEAGKYAKAYRLFEQILPQYRGKPQAEKLTFLHANCSYELGDYYISSYHFDKFVDMYPDSEKAEEASFLAAKGHYHNSPVYSKEQKETVEAIEKLQLFVNAYPNSQYLEEANELVKELDFKLEKKAFEIAKQYDLIKEYQAAIKAFNNFLSDFPGSKLREKALYYRLDAAYNLALFSIDVLKENRLKEAITFYEKLVTAFPETEFLEQANVMKEELQQQLGTYTTKI